MHTDWDRGTTHDDPSPSQKQRRASQDPALTGVACRGSAFPISPSQTLHAGDTIEAFTQAYVSGDPRGRRVAVILRVSNAADDYSIGIDNGELIPLTIMIKRRIDRFGNQVEAGSALWRKLRTFSLVAGSREAPTRVSLFNVSLQ